MSPEGQASTLGAFLAELCLDPPDATSDEAGVPLLDEDYVILSTIHSAEGQEWRAVFVLNGVDGCIASDLATGYGRVRGRVAAPLRRHDKGETPLAVIIPQRADSDCDRRDGAKGIKVEKLSDMLHRDGIVICEDQ